MSSTKIISTSPVGFAILKALATYRYLTTNQILALGLVKDRGYLGQVLTSLLSAKRNAQTGERKPKEIGELDFGTKVGKGRLPRMYYLTKRGAETLETLDPDSEHISYPTRVVRFAPDYEHRVACVDFHIAVATWAQNEGHQVINFRQYFDWSPASQRGNPQPITRLALSHKNIDADALFSLRAPDGTERAFLFEMANGIDTSRVLQKMHHIARGIADGSLNQALGFPADKAVRVVFVFEYCRPAELVATRAVTIPLLREYRDHFFLKYKGDLDPTTLPDKWLSLDPQLVHRPLF